MANRGGRYWTYGLMAGLFAFVLWVSTQKRLSETFRGGGGAGIVGAGVWGERDAWVSPVGGAAYRGAVLGTGLGADLATSQLPLLHGSFPLTGAMQVSGRSVEDNWRFYPVFSEPSFAPLTNNLRYPRNPDDGQCTPAEFCGALYHDRQDDKSNEVWPLPPVPEGPGARVGYFRAEPV